MEKPLSTYASSWERQLICETETPCSDFDIRHILLQLAKMEKCFRFCAKRMLKWYPKLLNDIYLSEAKPKIKYTIKHLFDNQEYYGENVLHMGCVAEDASLVKWLLDIGSDIHRWILGYSQVEIRISKYVSKYCTNLI